MEGENENFRTGGADWRTFLIKENSRIIKRTTLCREYHSRECGEAYRCRWSRDTKNSAGFKQLTSALLRASKNCRQSDKEWPWGCPRKPEEKTGCVKSTRKKDGPRSIQKSCKSPSQSSSAFSWKIISIYSDEQKWGKLKSQVYNDKYGSCFVYRAINVRKDQLKIILWQLNISAYFYLRNDMFFIVLYFIW